MMGYDIREVLPEVFRIPVPLEGNPLKELNSYLFRGSREAKQRNLLVDTGFRTEGCKKALLKGLWRSGVSMEDTDILLTHLHADHSGNAPELTGRAEGYISAGRITGLWTEHCRSTVRNASGKTELRNRFCRRC